tara:strand:+ start:36 stop:800 length:765 start_codon:yes stop_codon:yes gene_type:complete
MDPYKNKYLKYKNKYINLKKIQSGGSDNSAGFSIARATRSDSEDDIGDIAERAKREQKAAREQKEREKREQKAREARESDASKRTRGEEQQRAAIRLAAIESLGNTEANDCRRIIYDEIIKNRPKEITDDLKGRKNDADIYNYALAASKNTITLQFDRPEQKKTNYEGWYVYINYDEEQIMVPNEEVRQIVNYDADTGIATVAPDWINIPIPRKTAFKLYKKANEKIVKCDDNDDAVPIMTLRQLERRIARKKK